MKRLILNLGLVALAAISTACSSTSAGAPSDAPADPVPTAAVVIVARDMAFQPTTVTVDAGEPFAIVLDNQEDAPHNVAIEDSTGVDVFKGEIVSRQRITYHVEPLAAGVYPFICEVHPDMKGIITAL